MIRIAIAKDFTDTPGGRYRTDGPFSGQEFREDLLVPAMDTADHVVVDLEGVMGLPPSFLEEAFGGLVRAGHSPEDLQRVLRIVWRSPRFARYDPLIWSFIQAAAGPAPRRVG
jgi:hypothetical protein